ncbi:MAG: chromosome segregation protein SMC [Verrucomicrobiota bacterium]|nr:chromosome segregation protein SMC [Verrucomicrobiota bacterium]
MFLKTLELLGFKSFAPKTVLTFHRGVTCVVGPNGCGKSNVLDAVRWVLGEQSAKALRGGEMADVIFSGTDSRPALGMAEVSMTFAECEEALGLDWHEVTITRRVFRDGGSEYLLNKTPCRLKDIHQLFMDTGIGRSAYSIMEQGKIDMILSSRPEDRRAIFEEAAGITKYKAQKKEALRKLEATEANLLRLQDIIKEVRRQIGSLQRQAGKARRYQALLADLKMLETHAAKRQLDGLEELLTGTAFELQSLSDKQAECEKEVEREENEVSLRRSALAELEQRLNGARQGVGELRARISHDENRVVFNLERVREFESLVARYRLDVAGAEEKFRVAETQLRDTDAELAQITAMLAGELRLMEEKQASTAALTAQRQEAEGDHTSLGSEAARLENKLSTLRGQLTGVAEQRDSAVARLAVLDNEAGQISAALTRLSEQQAAAKSELDLAGAALERHTVALAEAETQLREVQSQFSEVDGELRAAQRALAEKESKAEVLRQLNEGGEGFSEGTQAVLRGLDNPGFFKPSVLGALARFIEVAPEYVVAVEAALGANLQAIVMKDAMIAESVIKTLSAQKLGKAALALRELSDFRFSISDFRLANPLPDGALGWLVDHVRCSEELAPLVQRLLAGVLLAGSIEEAIELHRKSTIENREFTIVTLAGEVLTANGILHGGATSEAVNSVLQRKNQITELEAAAGTIRAQIEEIARRRDHLSQGIEAAQLRLDEAREEKQNATVHVSTMRGQLGMLERELRDAEKKAQNVDWERQNSAQRHREAADRLKTFEAEMVASTQGIEVLHTRRAEVQNRLEIVRARESETAAELNTLRIKVATERQRHTSLHHQRLPMEQRLAELLELIAQRQRDIQGYQERAASTLAENEQIAASLEGLRDEIGEAELRVAQLLDERANIAAEVEDLSSTLRILRHQLNEAHDQRSRLEVKRAQLEMKLTALAEHIQKRYQIDLREFQRDLHGLRVAVRDHFKRQQRGGNGSDAEIEAALEPAASMETAASESDPGAAPGADAASPSEAGAPVEAAPVDDAFAIDWARVDAMVKEIEQKIDLMGPVNLDAIQEYDELEERYAFLEKQNADLTRSKAELIEVIQKINATTRTLFADTFEKIRLNFQEMFKELFDGGKANLLLVDEVDPLESGIDIIAKPPGKQLQSISLLSGGERTMTAVALLFSIYMVKPSPFCILDEMDAPLDESNINRFIKILDRFVGQSQFIVISHNKRTIARADAIYGVTMEEHGVSKLVGVKFTKRDESSEEIDLIGTNNPAPVPSVAETFGKSGELHREEMRAR